MSSTEYTDDDNSSVHSSVHSSSEHDTIKKSSPVVRRRKTLVFKGDDSFGSSSEEEDKQTPKRKKAATTTRKKPTVSTPTATPSFSFDPHLDTLVKNFGLSGDSLKIFLIFYFSNRPSSSTELALSLPKKALEAALTDLLDKDLIFQKIYNKAKLYMLNSSVCDYGDVEDLGESCAALKDSLRNIQKNLINIQNQLTENELEEKISLLESRIEKNKESLSKISSGELYTEEDVLLLSPKPLLKLLKERRSIYKNILDILTENLNMKKKEFLEEVGIEYEN